MRVDVSTINVCESGVRLFASEERPSRAWSSVRPGYRGMLRIVLYSGSDGDLEFDVEGACNELAWRAPAYMTTHFFLSESDRL